MSKHLLGFLVFSLITGAAGLLMVFRDVPSDSCQVIKKNTCWTLERSIPQTGETIVKQAVLNLKTKKINLELKTSDPDVALHFFIKDSKGTHYLETVTAESSSTLERETQQFCSANLRLDRLSPEQNLYIMTENKPHSDYRTKDDAPKFQPNSAIPVSLYAGKTNS